MYVRNYCPGLDIPWQIGFNRRIRKRSKHTVNSTKSLVSGKEKILCGHSKSATRLRFIREPDKKSGLIKLICSMFQAWMKKRDKFCCISVPRRTSAECILRRWRTNRGRSTGEYS
jgi:hypothetical protein